MTLEYALASGQKIGGGLVDWGDGTSDAVAPFPATASQAYPSSGLYRIVLIAQDDVALLYLTDSAWTTYEPIFTALFPHMPEILATYSPLRGALLRDGYAEYVVIRTIAGEARVFPIGFTRSRDGVWRIAGM